MQPKLQITFSVLNIISSIVLLLNAFNYWIISASAFGVGATQGICCFCVAAFVFCAEVTALKSIYTFYFPFYNVPVGRGVANIFLSFLTFAYTIWYSILSFVLLLAIGIANIVLYYTVEDVCYHPIIPHFGTKPVEKPDHPYSLNSNQNLVQRPEHAAYA